MNLKVSVFKMWVNLSISVEHVIGTWIVYFQLLFVYYLSCSPRSHFQTKVNGAFRLINSEKNHAYNLGRVWKYSICLSNHFEKPISILVHLLGNFLPDTAFIPNFTSCQQLTSLDSSGKKKSQCKFKHYKCGLGYPLYQKETAKRNIFTLR